VQRWAAEERVLAVGPQGLVYLLVQPWAGAQPELLFGQPAAPHSAGLLEQQLTLVQREPMSALQELAGPLWERRQLEPTWEERSRVATLEQQE